jgi:hypothetical protein
VTENEVEVFLRRKREAGLKIDPETAEIEWFHGQSLDPYELGIDIPEEMSQIERHYFARAPGSGEWVEFGELPDETREAIWRREDARIDAADGKATKAFRDRIREAVDAMKRNRDLSQIGEAH